MWLEFGCLLVASYLVGSIPMAYLVVKWRYGVDIRHYGSGQVGASNVFRSFSKPLAIPVFFYDVGKGILLVWIAQRLGMDTPMQIAVGIATIVGHNWPIFLNFNAGRGIATTLGVAFMLMPWGIWVFLAGAIFTLLLGSSPLPVLVSFGLLPLASWARHEPLATTLGLLALFLLIVFRRLTAPKTAGAETISTRELLLNRLLFDRDIRGTKTWLTIKPVTLKNFKKPKKG